MDIHEKVERVKKHLAENKAVYLVGSGCFVAGVLGTLVCSPTQINVNFSFLNWKSPQTSQNIQMAGVLGRRGDAIYAVETDSWYGSQNEAASALGVSRATLTKYFKGLLPDVHGIHLVNHGENLNPR